MGRNQTGLMLVFEALKEEDVGSYNCTATRINKSIQIITIKLTVTSEFFYSINIIYYIALEDFMYFYVQADRLNVRQSLSRKEFFFFFSEFIFGKKCKIRAVLK